MSLTVLPQAPLSCSQGGSMTTIIAIRNSKEEPGGVRAKQGGRDSNPRPLVLETSALTRLSYRPNSASV